MTTKYFTVSPSILLLLFILHRLNLKAIVRAQEALGSRGRLGLTRSGFVSWYRGIYMVLGVFCAAEYCDLLVL
jgi:hypothetical protein